MKAVQIPKDKKALARMMWRHGERGDAVFMYRRTMWLLAWYYLNGYRRFDLFDPSTGSMTPYHLDEEGNMEFQSQALLYKINQVSGRLQAMDTRPKVNQQGQTLAGMRSRSVAQILADATISENQVELAKEQCSWLFACLGFAGLQGHISNEASIGLTNDIEVIHPKELRPFPTMGENTAQDHGIMRTRVLPMQFLKDLYGDTIARRKDDLEYYEVDPGDSWIDRADNYAAGSSPSAIMSNSGWGGQTFKPGDDTTGKDWTEVVRVRELWVKGPTGLVSQYVTASGDLILDNQDLRDLEVYCPIGYGRFFNNGTWWGAGMFDILFSQHRQFELLCKALYNNVRDIDRYGVVVLPQGEFNKNTVLHDVGRGLRALFWSPDPLAEGFRPFAISPVSSGDLPGKTAAFAQEQMERNNPIQDLIKEKGRVDSAAGLSFLDEQIQQALTTPSRGMQRMWGDMWRSSVQVTTQRLMMSGEGIHVNHLTLDLAGAVIDPESEMISFDKNPVPALSRLNFSIQQASPSSKVARKMEMIRLWEVKLETDPVAFKFQAWKEGLDFPLWSEDEGAFQRSIKVILQLFNDGEEPGEIALDPTTIKPEIMVRLVTMMMTSPHMAVASPDVINQFQLLRDFLMGAMGMTLPAAIPNPDDLALLMQQQESAGMGPEMSFQQPQLPM
jgi:hypothetical protein